MSTADPKKTPPGTAPSHHPSHAEPRRDGGPRESNVTEHERDADPGRSADRLHPGSDTGAGPHAQPSLTNEDATPGAGTLPDPAGAGSREDVDVDAGTG